MDKPLPNRMTVDLPDRPPLAQPRKIVQIAVAPAGTEHEPDVVALCNDGTVWILSIHGQWHQLPAIPQQEDGL